MRAAMAGVRSSANIATISDRRQRQRRSCADRTGAGARNSREIHPAGAAGPDAIPSQVGQRLW